MARPEVSIITNPATGVLAAMGLVAALCSCISAPKSPPHDKPTMARYVVGPGNRNLTTFEAAPLSLKIPTTGDVSSIRVSLGAQRMAVPREAFPFIIEHLRGAAKEKENDAGGSNREEGEIGGGLLQGWSLQTVESFGPRWCPKYSVRVTMKNGDQRLFFCDDSCETVIEWGVLAFYRLPRTMGAELAAYLLSMAGENR